MLARRAGEGSLAARAVALTLGALVGCGAETPSTSPPSPPSPSPSPAAEEEDFSEQWCLAVDPLVEVLDDAPFVTRDRAAISDLTVTAGALDRLTTDLQDAGLSQSAADVRLLAARVREYVDAIDVHTSTADDLLRTLEDQGDAVDRMGDPLDAALAAFGRC